MFNPFAESASGDADDVVLVERAQSGDRTALEELVLRHQAWIYNIAVRMVFHPHDAEEVTQEVLVKIITKLSTFHGKSKFRTWLYRIAANHVLNMKRRGAETQSLTFADYGAASDATGKTCGLQRPCASDGSILRRRRLAIRLKQFRSARPNHR